MNEERIGLVLRVDKQNICSDI